jgi:hypothetical protein
VSVLPQLQRELSAAHARRRRRRLPRVARIRFGFGGAPVVVAGAVAVAVVVVAIVALRPSRAPERPAGAAAVVYRGFISFTYAAAGSLYGILPDKPDSPSVSSPLRLVRIDPGGRGVVARQLLAPPGTHSFQPIPEPEHLLLAAGSLWVSTTDSQRSWLWRLDSRSLAVRRLTVLPGGGAGGSGSLAAAGGWLWVINRNTLLRVSLQTGRVAGSRTISRSIAGLGNTIAADARGRRLALTVAGPRTGSRVELLNPATGAPIASSRPFAGSTPQLVGLLAAGAWINGLTATDGPVRLDLNTLKVTATVGRFPLTAQVFGGVVVVSSRGTARCVDALTGRTLATLPNVVAAEGSTAYVRSQRRGIPEIHRQALDPRCLPGS